MKFLVSLFLIIFSTQINAKTLTIVTSSGTGIPFNNVKLISEYIKTYDNTVDNVIIKVVPGAGGINAANYIYNIADKDGYTIGTFQSEAIIKSLIIDKNIQYDISEFTWIGSSSDGRIDSIILAVNKLYDGNIMNIGELNPNGSIVNYIHNITGWNIKMIAGYPNKPAMKLAFERKEIDGYFISIYAHPDRNNIIAAFQINRNRSPLLKNVPTLRELTKNKNNLELVEFIELSNILTRPFVAPSNIPKDRQNKLRHVFNSIASDKEYIDRAEKLQINVSLIDWKESVDIVNKMKSIDKDTIKKLISPNLL